MTAWSVEGLAARLDHFSLGPVDLALEPGRAVAVLGTSGAGKTTLLRTLAGFVPPSAGRVLRDGADITSLAPEARCLGYVPQGLGLLPHRTVERNVSYPRELRGDVEATRHVRPLLERFGLAPLARRRPAQLSGGEAERVALARALAADPELVLWDEPWQGLDVEAQHDLGFVFAELRDAARVPVVVVTHDPGLAFSIADRFLVLRQGRVRFWGEPRELLQRPFDAFTARFVGYENVFDPAALAEGAPGSLAAWLRARAGSDGIAFARPTVSPEEPNRGTWQGIVRTVRPTPEGFTLTAAVDALPVVLRVPAPVPFPIPAVGSRVRFDLGENDIRPLGPAGAPGGSGTGR